MLLDPTVRNKDNENSLHVAIQSESEDSDIEQVTDLLLKNRLVWRYTTQVLWPKTEAVGRREACYY